MNIAFRACIGLAGIGGALLGLAVVAVVRGLHGIGGSPVLLGGLAVVFLSASRWMFQVGKAKLYRSKGRTNV